MTRRRSLLLAAGGFVLVDAIYRLFEGSRPIDWLILGVDGLVLFVIVLFEAPEWWHKRSVAKKTKSLIPLLEAGRHLQFSIPYQHQEISPELSEWADTAKSWWEDAESVLANMSPKAAVAFSHINFAPADRTAMDRSGRPYHVSGYIGDIYQTLQMKLNNLKNVIENPETYL
jgi:hypothetical protein